MWIDAKDLLTMQQEVFLEGYKVTSVSPCAGGVEIWRDGDIPLWRANNARIWVDVRQENNYEKWLREG